MSRIKRAMVACAAVASIAAAGAAPAQAQDIYVAPNPCTQSLPDCTAYTFDTARGSIEFGRTTWNTAWGIGEEGICGAYEYVTKEPCPGPAEAVFALGYLQK